MSLPRRVRRAIRPLLPLAVAACAATNPYGIEGDDFATLHNWSRTDETSGAVTSFLFSHADGHYLFQGLVTPRAKQRIRIPTGERRLIVEIVHLPHGYFPQGFSPSGSELYKTFVRFTVTAAKGVNYRANGTIDGRNAEVWIEEAGGERVSEVVSAPLSAHPEALEKVY